MQRTPGLWLHTARNGVEFAVGELRSPSLQELHVCVYEFGPAYDPVATVR